MSYKCALSWDFMHGDAKKWLFWVGFILLAFLLLNFIVWNWAECIAFNRKKNSNLFAINGNFRVK